MKPIHYEYTRRSLAALTGQDLEQVHDALRRDIGDATETVRKRVATMRHPLLRRMMAEAAARGVNGGISWGHYLEEFMAMYAFWRSGKHVFNVSAGLTQMLLNTELRVQKRFFRMPFNCVYLSFEDAPVWLERSEDGCRAPLRGVYVYRTTDCVDSQSRIMALPQPERDAFLRRLIDEGRVNPEHESVFVDRELLKFLFISDFIDQDAQDGVSHFTWFPLFLAGEDDTLEEGMIERVRREYTEGDPSPNDLAAMERLAMNALLYVTSVGADLRPVKANGSEIEAEAARAKDERKRERLLRRSSRRCGIDYIDVGRDVAVPSGAGAAEERREGRTWTLTHKIHVRGFFKRIHKLKVNLTEEERKCLVAEDGDKASFWKWISPHTRGPEMAEAINKQYKVG